ncbi:proline-rich protein 36-like [Acanthaster planci]|uniref:Proline-rich protein 36-like n=1 Tax=Acanthaster planci TaxID=133434 RepID=A0A8B7Y4M8_ACAPL|nr:proline-rich protein 36-like [Acanthaster planci]
MMPRLLFLHTLTGMIASLHLPLFPRLLIPLQFLQSPTGRISAHLSLPPKMIATVQPPAIRLMSSLQLFLLLKLLALLHCCQPMTAMSGYLSLFRKLMIAIPALIGMMESSHLHFQLSLMIPCFLPKPLTETMVSPHLPLLTLMMPPQMVLPSTGIITTLPSHPPSLVTPLCFPKPPTELIVFHLLSLLPKMLMPYYLRNTRTMMMVFPLLFPAEEDNASSQVPPINNENDGINSSITVTEADDQLPPSHSGNLGFPSPVPPAEVDNATQLATPTRDQEMLSPEHSPDDDTDPCTPSARISQNGSATPPVPPLASSTTRVDEINSTSPPTPPVADDAGALHRSAGDEVAISQVASPESSDTSIPQSSGEGRIFTSPNTDESATVTPPSSSDNHIDNQQVAPRPESTLRAEIMERVRAMMAQSPGNGVSDASEPLWMQAMRAAQQTSPEAHLQARQRSPSPIVPSTSANPAIHPCSPRRTRRTTSPQSAGGQPSEQESSLTLKQEIMQRIHAMMAQQQAVSNGGNQPMWMQEMMRQAGQQPARSRTPNPPSTPAISLTPMSTSTHPLTPCRPTSPIPPILLPNQPPVVMSLVQPLHPTLPTPPLTPPTSIPAIQLTASTTACPPAPTLPSNPPGVPMPVALATPSVLPPSLPLPTLPLTPSPSSPDIQQMTGAVACPLHPTLPSNQHAVPLLVRTTALVNPSVVVPPSTSLTPVLTPPQTPHQSVPTIPPPTAAAPCPPSPSRLAAAAPSPPVPPAVQSASPVPVTPLATPKKRRRATIQSPPVIGKKQREGTSPPVQTQPTQPTVPCFPAPLPSESSFIPIQKYDDLEDVTNQGQAVCLGTGAFGDILLKRRKSDASLVAVKQLRNVQDPNEAYSKMIKEIRCMMAVQHHREFPKVWGIIDQTTFAIEFIGDGTNFTSTDLYFFLVNPPSGLTTVDYINICLDISRGLLALHEAGWSHNDLHNGNVMIWRDPSRSNNWAAKIIDLGLTTRIDLPPPTFMFDSPKKAWCYQNCPHMAPEIVEGVCQQGVKGDIYSLGDLFHIIADNKAELNFYMGHW